MSNHSKGIEHVLVLNHHRDALDGLVQGLRQAGYEVTEARAIAETRRILNTVDPALIVLNPLVVKGDGVEFELIAELTRGDEPVPVILLVDNVEALQQARELDLPYRDFLVRPHADEELVHRVELGLSTRRRFQALEERARDLEGQMTIDFKTGLLSERHFKQLLQVEFKRAQRHRMPLSLLLLDVDNFKSVNDSTEYAFGDEVLRHVALSLKRNIRETDFAARLGGDEFVVLLPQTTPAEAVQTAIRIRKKTSQTIIQDRRYSLNVTLSIGIDTFDGRAESSPEELRRRANKALQEAKRRGKNQVWLYSTETTADDGAPEPQRDDAHSDDAAT